MLNPPMALAGADSGDAHIPQRGLPHLGRASLPGPTGVSNQEQLFTVIICTHSVQRYNDTLDSINSVLSQSHGNVEVILVVDRDPELFERLQKCYADNLSVIVLLNKDFPGLSGSRNIGIRQSKGDFIAFLDDDAVADPHWLSHLLKTYEDERVIGCGGPIRPLWITGEAKYIPEEFYWVMGCTYKGFKNEMRTIRSNFGSNMSFRRVAFEIDAFDVRFGVLDGKGVGEELEFSLRLLKRNPDTVIIHNPESIVYHKIFNYRKSVRHLFGRCIEYGKSIGQHARELEDLPPQVERDDRNMINFLLFDSVPERITKIFKRKGADKGTFSIELIQLILMGFSSILIVSGIARTRLLKSGWRIRR